MKNIIVSILIIVGFVFMFIELFFNDKKEKQIERIEISKKTQAEKIELDNKLFYKKKTEDSLNKIIATNTIDRLKIKFNFRKDEFSDGNTVFVSHKSNPKYVNRNGVFLEINTSNDLPTGLYFNIQYFADDWLFIKSYSFNIDGQVFSYMPYDIKTDNGNGNIWEWSSSYLNDDNEPIIRAIANAKSVKLRFNGRQYFDNRNLSSKEIQAIKESLEYYDALKTLSMLRY